MENRADTDLAKVVAAGISIDNARGSAIAWAFMSDRNVPTKVILRVLTSGKGSRWTDPTLSPSLSGKAPRVPRLGIVLANKA